MENKQRDDDDDDDDDDDICMMIAKHILQVINYSDQIML